MDILRLRFTPGSAVFFGLTRRCPLTCRHCSTNSLLSSAEHSADIFLGFVDTFTPEDHPQVLMMSGGEALLRPRLVREIAQRARAVGTATHLLSGMFFARGHRVPRPIREAIAAVDHFAASLDVFHEEQVARDRVLAVLEEVHAAGKDVSLQLVGMDDDDPYLAAATADVRAAFDDAVPMIVGLVGRNGRAADWLPDRRTLTHLPFAPVAEPCGMAAWPIVAFDGTVIACCNQDLVDAGAAAPAHLRLGHASTDGWPEVRAKCRGSSALRVVRTLGPWLAADAAGLPVTPDYCGTCRQLSAPAAAAWTEARTDTPTFPILEAEVRRLQQEEDCIGFLRRYGSARYAELARLGYHRPGGVDRRERQCAG